MPNGRNTSKPIRSAGLFPTSSMTMSAPRPSVASNIRLRSPSGSSLKFKGSAPRLCASSSRLGTLSIANRCAGLYSNAAMSAQSPTGPHPMRTAVAVACLSGLRAAKALRAAKYPLPAVRPGQFRSAQRYEQGSLRTWETIYRLVSHPPRRGLRGVRYRPSAPDGRLGFRRAQ